MEFDTPTGLFDPFTYTVTQTPATGSDSPAKLQGSPIVTGGKTKLTVTDLTAGTTYTFKVTATGTNGAATSQPSDSIIAS